MARSVDGTIPLRELDLALGQLGLKERLGGTVGCQEVLAATAFCALSLGDGVVAGIRPCVDHLACHVIRLGRRNRYDLTI